LTSTNPECTSGAKKTGAGHSSYDRYQERARPCSVGTDTSGTKNVAAARKGVELAFGHDVLHEQYPRVKLKGAAYVPYLKFAWLGTKLEALPTYDTMMECFGKPRPRGRGEWWLVDPARAIEATRSGDQLMLAIVEARSLAHAEPSTQLFAAWAAQVGLLEPTRFEAYPGLLDRVRAREARADELVGEAFPRGIWDVHLVDREGLRDFAYAWFHNMRPAGGPERIYIRDDLVSVCGSRVGTHGHDEPILDDVTWDAIDRAAPRLADRFARWL
jgi:hypothetical protein